MKFPKEINTYCPFCKTHTVHKVKLYSKKGGTGRSMAKGTRKHDRKLKGYGGKRKGMKTPKKQGKRQKVILTCTVCKKKHERVLGTRTKKKLEVQ
ncbi:50S ribosomal protein L44e [Candidatus Micrarchaeota archaeon]|nr:50S ribosomal protein L44e [Candidatus Micrarchaeota archaeon]